jgi:hypothetical protein
MMRTLLTLLILVTGYFNLFGQNQLTDTIEIKSAIDSSLIKIEIEGFYGKSKFRPVDNTGFYYGQCITITIENETDSIIIVEMPVGSILKCKDTTVQDMIVTKQFAINLYPKNKEGFLIYAMCGEISDAGPSAGIFYDYGGLASEEVVKTAKMIQEKNIQNIIGQHTMWAVRNDADSTKLLHYGATLSSLQTIVNNLSEINIETKLTSQVPALKDEPIIQTIQEKQNNVIEKESDFEINTLSIILSALCGILLITIIVLVRKNKNNIA